jgi:hypothetical protein
MWEIVFLANAIGAAYEDFIVPFAHFALAYHRRGFVEIVVVDHTQFEAAYALELAELRAVHGDTRFAVRSMDKPPNAVHVPNTYRFLEVPHAEGRYTYVMDVDVMLLEDVVPPFERRWPADCAFSNVVRDPAAEHPRLTGMMMVRSAQYYTPALKARQAALYGKHSGCANDEHILYTLAHACHAMPPPDFRWRPIFGIHFSPNRGRDKSMQLKTSSAYASAFRQHALRLPRLFSLPVFAKLCAQLEQFTLVAA